jgi:hypothetical protein
MVQCNWCGMVDERKKVYASPGDDLENPVPFHEKCSLALNHFKFLLLIETDKSLEQKVIMANKLAKIDIKTRK